MPAPLADGERLLARYQVLRSLGRGEVSDTYEARDATNGATVVVHVLDTPRDPTTLSSFDQQTREVGRLNPAFVGHRELAQSERGPVLVSTHLGKDLATATSAAPLGVLSSLAASTLLSKALKQLHDAGYVHGSLHPGNLFAPSPSQLHIVGQGFHTLRRALGARNPGKAGYLAPEIAQGGAPSTEGDVYAAALVTFLLATGIHPFRSVKGDNVDSHALWAEMHAPIDLTERSREGARPMAPEVAKALEALLSPDPYRRGRDLAAVVAALGGGGVGSSAVADFRKKGAGGTVMMEGGDALWKNQPAAAPAAGAPATPPPAPPPVAPPPNAPGFGAGGGGASYAPPPPVPAAANPFQRPSEGGMPAVVPPAANPFQRPSDGGMPAVVPPAVAPPAVAPPAAVPVGDAGALRMIPERTRIRTVLALQHEFPDFMSSTSPSPDVAPGFSGPPAAGSPAVPVAPGFAAPAPVAPAPAMPPALISRSAEPSGPAPPQRVEGGAEVVEKQVVVHDLSTTFYVAAAREDLMRPVEYGHAQADGIPPSMNDELRMVVDNRPKKWKPQTIALIVGGAVFALIAVILILWALLRVDDGNKFPTSQNAFAQVTRRA